MLIVFSSIPCPLVRASLNLSVFFALTIIHHSKLSCEYQLFFHTVDTDPPHPLRAGAESSKPVTKPPRMSAKAPQLDPRIKQIKIKTGVLKRVRYYWSPHDRV